MRITIESLAAGGDGVGHVEGLAVFVPGSAPGDTVEVSAGPVGQGRMRATLERVLEEGRARVNPACPRASVCGGCQWLHVSYPTQVEAKLEILRRALRVGSVGVEVSEVQPAPSPLGYRRRARLRWAKKAGPALGFYRPQTHRIVDAIDGGPTCPVLTEPLRSVLPELRRSLMDPAAPDDGQADLLAGADGRVHVALSSRVPVEDPGLLERIGAACGAAGVGARTTQGFRWWGASSVNLAPDGSSVLWGSAACFSQANEEVNQHLVRKVGELCGPQAGGILELYAGIGNFTRALCGLGPIRAVERSGPSYRLLRKSLAEWDPPFPAAIRRADAGHAVADLVRARAPVAAVVLDPPRQGCHKLLPGLARLGIRRIVYVSCDPMTLARDLALLDDSGFTPTFARGLDTMPQTSHFELVAVAERR